MIILSYSYKDLKHVQSVKKGFLMHIIQQAVFKDLKCKSINMSSTGGGRNLIRNSSSPDFSPCVLPMFWLPLLFFPCRRLPARHHGLRRAQPNLQCEQTQTLWTYFRFARADHQDVRVGLKHIQASASAGGGSSDN